MRRFIPLLLKVISSSKVGWCLTLPLLLAYTNLQAQFIVQGRVTSDDGEGLPGVNIVLKGTPQGAISDTDGSYRIEVPDENSILYFSFIGFVDEEVAVNGRSIINVVLLSDITTLEEVVVVGYGQQRKREVTGAISSIKSEELLKLGTSDFGSAMQGQLAGVSVRSASGAPGENMVITIRGTTAFTPNRNGAPENRAGPLIENGSEPLYVVDGVTYVTNPNITPQEIESIEVLKDGASAAIYGSRASGGVILITTKAGRKGRLKVSLDSFYGIQNITSDIHLANTRESLFIADLQNRYQETGEFWPLENNPDALLYDTDWLEELQVDNAAMQNHSLTINGGKEDIQFNVVGNFFSQDGSLVNSAYDKQSIRTNISFGKDKFSAQTVLGFARGARTKEPWALQYEAIRQAPYRPGLNPGDESFVITGTNPENLGDLVGKLKQESELIDYNVNGNIRLNYELIDGLNISANIGGSFFNADDRFFAPVFSVFNENGELNPRAGNQISTLQNATTTTVRTIQEYMINYEKSFGDHNFNFLLGNTYETQNFDWRRVRGTALSSNDTPTFDNAAAASALQDVRKTKTFSYLGRLRYAFKSRYLLTAVLRRDASSRFGPENRVGWFSSVSVGWNVSEEKFFAPLKGVINDFKIRYGYGQTGSDKIPDYAYSPVVISNADYVFGSGADETLVGGLSQPGFADPSIRWETNTSNNLGFDLQFLEGRVNLTVDVYRQDKRDMLLPVATSVSDGAFGNFDTVIRNTGNMENEGVEIAAGFRENIGELSFNISGTFTRNRNRVISMARGETIFGGWPNIVRVNQTEPSTVYKEGLEAGAFYLIPTDGLIQTQEELANYQAGLKDNIGANAQLGDVRYVDVNGDSVINIEDRVYQGSGNPDFEYGLNLGLEYKGFDFTLQFYGVEGVEIFNGPKLYAYATKRHRDIVYAWSDNNPTSQIPTPREEIEHPNVRTNSDFFLEDGSFLRVRNIILGYTLPASLTSRWHIAKLRVYLSAQNPITFTNYDGFDPEVASPNPLLNGIDTGKYPVTAVYRAGLTFDF